MIPELGSLCIAIACTLSIWLGLLSIVKVSNNSRYILSLKALLIQVGLLTLAMILLITSFLNNDLSVMYVREHSHQLLPLIYRIGAAWGGHEGSLLLWCLILSGWACAFAIINRHSMTLQILNRMISILGWMNAGFITFLLFTSNPFKRDFSHIPFTGNDLTPILQDPGLIFHPPMLYLGYVGFAIIFAFAIAILKEGKLEHSSANAMRPWIILPWSFLSFGIVLGSWWAYRELGWGGWWFWDPVENASLLPWLAATACFHSLIVSEKRQTFFGWTLFLAIITFSLSLIGTFLVRSGIIVSVHAFANDPTRGLFLLGYLGILILGSLSYYAYKIPGFFHQPKFKIISRETFMLLNSVFLVTAIAIVLLGTIYPVILDALGLAKLSVGEPYYTTLFVPLMLPLLILMGLAPHIKWNTHSNIKLNRSLLTLFILSFILALLLPTINGYPLYLLTTIGLTTALWVIFATCYKALSYKGSFLKFAAMILAHLGIGILAIGIIVNKSYSTEKQLRIKPNEQFLFAHYDITFKSLNKTKGANFMSDTAQFEVYYNNKLVELLQPEQRIYSSNNELLNKPDVGFTIWRDIYITLGNELNDNQWSIRIYFKPFVRWIWAGGIFLLIGGFFSIANSQARRQ